MSYAVSVRRFVVAAFAVAAIAPTTAACGDHEVDVEDAEAEEEKVESQASAATSCPTCINPNQLPAGQCPVGATTAQKKALQQKVTAALHFALGGAEPPSCNGPISITGNGSGLRRLRNLLESGKCTIYGANNATVCGLTAAVYPLYCSELNQTQYMALRAITSDVRDCWGQGADGFFNVGASGTQLWQGTITYYLNMTVDPEPARATLPLLGSNGASAAAVYVNSQAGTTVYRWTSSFLYGPHIPAGAPCSWVNLNVNDVTLKTIQAVGTSRRCI